MEVFLSIQLDEKGYVIIGEAALALALREQNIDVLSLINELNSMAEFSLNDERLYSISEARSWLIGLNVIGEEAEAVPYIKTLTSLNDK